MWIGQQRATWARDFSTAPLVASAGTAFVERALALAEPRFVPMLVASGDGRDIIARVRSRVGSDIHNVRVVGGEDTISASCSCGASGGLQMCVHALAVVLAVRGPKGEHPEDDGEVAVSGSDVGIEFSLFEDHVEIRPVRRGRGGRWAASGNGWQAFTDPRGVRWASTEQSDAIFDLYQVYLRDQRQTFAYGSRRVRLDALDADVWPALREAAAAGVAFVAGPGVAGEELALADAPAVPEIDVRRADDGELTARATIGGRPARAGRIVPIGEPMHGALILTRDGAHLVQLRLPASDVVAALCAEGTRRIARPGAAQFLARDVPQLALNADVTSADGSADLPDVRRPRIAVRARSVPGTEPSAELTFDLRAGDLADDVAARVGAELLQALRAAGPDAVAHLIPTDRGAGGTWRVRATGAAEVERARDTLLPWLAAHGDVDVEETAIAGPDATASVPLVRIGAREAAAPTRASAWLDLDIDVSVGGERVPFEALFAALAGGAETLHLASGRWISLDHPSLKPLQTLLEEAHALNTRADDGLGRVSVSTFDAVAAAALAEIGTVTDDRTQAWVQRLEKLATLTGADLAGADADIPPTVHADLRDYQRRGVAWADLLWRTGLGGVLADDMGLGKTLQILAATAIAKREGRADAPVLVIAPTSVVGGWVEQAEKFTPDLRVTALTQSAQKTGDDLAALAAGADILVTSYALARIDADALAAVHFSALVIDEAQFVKNPSSKTFRSVRAIGSDVVLAITGTPLENSLTDLWAMFALAAPGLLGSLKQFQRRFKKPIETGEDPQVRAERRADLRRLLAPFLLRRTKAQVAGELPDKQDQVVAIELEETHRRRYDRQLQVERKRVLGLLGDAEKNRVAILRSLTVLRRLALDVRLAPAEEEAEPHRAGAPSAKTKTLVDNLLEIASEGHRALVFSQFTSYLALVRAELERAGIPYAYLDGATRSRARVIDEFRSGAAPVFLISLKAGGFGLNLTEADYVFLLDPWWNPAVEEQAVDRAHRIGQTRNVNVYRFVAADTIEEKVVALQERKRRLFDEVIGDGADFGSLALSAADVRELLEEAG